MLFQKYPYPLYGRCLVGTPCAFRNSRLGPFNNFGFWNPPPCCNFKWLSSGWIWVFSGTALWANLSTLHLIFYVNCQVLNSEQQENVRLETFLPPIMPTKIQCRSTDHLKIQFFLSMVLFLKSTIVMTDPAKKNTFSFLCFGTQSTSVSQYNQ